MISTRRRYEFLIIWLLLTAVVLCWPGKADTRNQSLNNDLIDAIKKGEAQKVSELIRAGADPNATKSDGRITALMYAAHRGSGNMVQLLIAAGADINASDANGRTALIWAADANGNVDTVNILLANGADVNAKTRTTETALMAAAGYRDNEKVIHLLLSKGAQVNNRSKDGNSALIIAAFLGGKEIVKVLLDAGADINASNNQGFTAWAAAGASGDISTMWLLGWGRLLIWYLSIVLLAMAGGLAFWPSVRHKKTANTRRRNALKIIFWSQIICDLLLVIYLISDRLLTRPARLPSPSIFWGYVFGFVGIAGIIASFLTIFITRKSLLTRAATSQET